MPAHPSPKNPLALGLLLALMLLVPVGGYFLVRTLLPGEPTLGAIPRLRKSDPATQIVVLTMESDPAFARDALRAGAIAYVLKDAADTELVQAVRHAAQAAKRLSADVVNFAASGSRLRSVSRASRVVGVTLQARPPGMAR